MPGRYAGALVQEPLPHRRGAGPYVRLADRPGQCGRLGLQGRRAVGRGAGQAPSLQASGGGSQHRGVERVGETGGALLVDVDETVGLQAFQGVLVERSGGHGERLAEGQAVQGLALAGTRTVEEVRGALAHGRGDRHRAAPRPLGRVRYPVQQPLVAHRVHQLAQESQIAPAHAVQPVDGEGFEAADAGREQLRGLLTGQRLQGEPRQEFPGPQAGDRARRAAPVRGDDQQTGAAVHGELVDQGRRGVVQQMGVVDEQQSYA